MPALKAAHDRYPLAAWCVRTGNADKYKILVSQDIKSLSEAREFLTDRGTVLGVIRTGIPTFNIKQVCCVCVLCV